MSAGRLVVVGAGRVGLSLAADLAGMGLFSSIRVVGRRAEPPPFLSEAAPEVAYAEAAPEVAFGRPSDEKADVLLFCVPDDALAAAAAEWAGAEVTAAADVPSAGRIALHTSGLHPAAVLQPLRARGWRCGSWHPLVALAAPRTGAFEGVAVGVEGEAEAVALSERLARAVGARTIPIQAGEKDHYHAGAVFASNFLVACLAVARREVARAAEAGGEVTPEHLLPLARSALENVARHGLERGATGPVARGDVGTVARHLSALDGRTAALYRALALELLGATEERPAAPDGASRGDAPGRGPTARERLAKLLESEARGPSTAGR